jgi:hypothetical protein
MPTLEPTYDQTEELFFAAIKGKELDPELAAWADKAYRDLEHWALVIYNGVRLVGSRIYEREKAIIFWKGQWDWALGRLNKLRQTEQRFITAGVITPPALVATIQTTREITEACRTTYELMAGPMPESFLRAMNDFNQSRFVPIETAHHEPPPPKV